MNITLSSKFIDSTKDIQGYYPETPNQQNILIHPNSLDSLINIFRETESFKQSATLISSDTINSHHIDNILDGNTNTSWQPWFGGKVAWFEISFNQEKEISEIQWLTNTGTPPASYEYQVPVENNWITIFSRNDHKVGLGQYTIDKIPTIKTKKLRMQLNLYPYSGDNPGISEMEILSHNYGIDPQVYETFTNKPLAFASNEKEAKRILKEMDVLYKLKLYATSDKYPTLENTPYKKAKLHTDGLSHDYTFILDPQGTALNSLYLEFPNIPTNVELKKISLTQINDAN